MVFKFKFFKFFKCSERGSLLRLSLLQRAPHPIALYVVSGKDIVCRRGTPSPCIVCCIMLYCMVGGSHIPLRCMLCRMLLYCMVEGAHILLHCMLQYMALCRGGRPHPPALYAVLDRPALYSGVGPHPPALYGVSYCIVRCVVERALTLLHCMLYHIVLCGVWWRGPPSSCVV